jgi:hypothetical protein
VGDEAFTRKCLEKIGEFRRRGKTIVIVTHSLGLVEKMCDEALWLRKGKVADHGDPKRVVDAYLSFVAGGENTLLAERDRAAVIPADTTVTARVSSTPPEEKKRWGSGDVTIDAVRLVDSDGRARHVFVTGEPIRIELSVRSAAPVEDFVFGVGLFTADGVSVYGTNTDIEGYASRRMSGAATVSFVVDELRLVEGSYLLDVAAHRKDGTPYDYHRGLHSFRVRSRVKDVGVYRPRHAWSFAGDVAIEARARVADLDLSAAELDEQSSEKT